jgi:hypothetical protein
MSRLGDLLRRRQVTPHSKGVGDIYTFKTHPFTEFSDPETNRYGAFKVISIKGELTLVAVMDVVTIADRPTVKQVLASHVLIERRFSFAQHTQPAVCNVYTEGISKYLRGVEFSVNIAPSPEELRYASSRESYSSASWVSVAAEGEWRWVNDRDRLVAEWALHEEREKEKRDAEELRLKKRLKLLTWEQLLKEKHFSHWELPPKQFTLESRKLINETIRKFQLLPAKPKRKLARRVLVEAILAFNLLDKKFGEVIETEEREDIMMLIDEIGYVAKQRSLVPELDELREW